MFTSSSSTRNDSTCRERVESDPFAMLGGLHPFEASEADVRAAFRALALSSHPDKHTIMKDDVTGDLTRRPSMDALIDARDRAIKMIARRPPPWQWAIWVACTVLAATSAAPIDASVDVTLGDLHSARVKKIGIGVIRVGAPGGPFTRQRQPIFVRLVNPSRTTSIADDPIVFPGAGDDAPAAILLEEKSRRGDVIVRVRVIAHPIYSPDPVLWPNDLHARAAVSLRGHYLGEKVSLPHPASSSASASAAPSSSSIEVEYAPSGECECGCDDARQISKLEGLGLPFYESNRVLRGDLYVFLHVMLPPNLFS